MILILIDQHVLMVQLQEMISFCGGVKANAASGMAVHDDCKLKFLELKAKRTYRFIVYKIEEQQKQVVVEKLGEPGQSHDDFAASLPADECRYAIFDFDFVTAENCQKSKIFFIAWSPDTARVRSKMIYASSKDRFKRELDGIQLQSNAEERKREEKNIRLLSVTFHPKLSLDSRFNESVDALANAASGMAVHDDCKLRFLELKAKRTHRFIVYKIEEKQKQVVVEKVGEPVLSYEDFAASLPAEECRYAIYDFDFVTTENCQKSKIFFIAWCPDVAKVRSKMIYASSKDRFKRELDGIQVELQATDPTEMDLDVFKSRVN
ncbi:hypothetical protein HID58_051126 [Brassica napus]|uniref:ADF-H domain-containing protein n=3 Tax=Brassica TaxID=3705 RepID=A0ABQ8A8R1_BRANA|nr:hypothetical protein HID58_051126 [Brassica napus]